MSARLRLVVVSVALLIGVALVTPTEAQSRFWVLVNGALRYNGSILVGNGSATAPSQSFVSETNTGWYLAGATNLSAAVGGNSILSITGGGITTNAAGAAYQLSGVKLIVATAPTISSGFGTSPSILNSNGSATFRIDVGTGGSATTGVVGLPTAATGWNCQVTDKDTNVVTRQTASTTTTATVTAASAWAASDDLIFNCAAY